MLKLKSSSLTMALSMLAAGGAVQASEHCHHSIDVGVGLGDQHGNFEYKVNEAQNVPATQRKFDASKHAIAGGPSLGYRFKWKKVMFGLETDYLFSDLKRTINPNFLANGVSRFTRVKSEGAWGGAVKLGYYFKDHIVAYAGAGFENRRFKVDYIVALEPENSIQRRSTETAFAPRVGLEFYTMPHVLLGVEYRKAFYSDKTFKNGATTVKFKPEAVDTVLINMRYAFHLHKKI